MIGASLFRGVPSLSRVGYVSCNPPRYGLYLCLHTLNDDDISLYALHLTLPSKDNEPTHDLVYFTFSSEFWSWVFFIDTILVVGIRQKTHNSENTAPKIENFTFSESLANPQHDCLLIIYLSLVFFVGKNNFLLFITPLTGLVKYAQVMPHMHLHMHKS